jgi:hypothetical protein
MAREKWEEIVAYYKTYMAIIEPLLLETRRTVIRFEPEELIDKENLEGILEEEIKRKVSKVKAIAEFNAFFRKEIFKHILNYIDEIKDEFSAIDIKDNIIDFIDEAIGTLDMLLNLVNDDPNLQENSLLYILCQKIMEIIFPQKQKLNMVYDSLIEKSTEWYEAQRYLLLPTNFYREAIDESSIPGLSPKIYQIVNNITSLFNLEPNYLDMDENPDYVIPAIMVADIFEPYIDKIANAEEEAIKKICNRMELKVIDQIFIGPTEQFITLAKEHKFVSSQEDADGKTRWLPQFSNETLILLYLAKVSFRRGFLSKELINWIAMNFAFIIYNALLHTVLSDDNIFYNLFLDLKTEEKILPYLMKLLCFDKYLRLDRSKIRDSPTYRKEIFTFLGGKISAIDHLTYFLVDEIEKIKKVKK